MSYIANESHTILAKDIALNCGLSQDALQLLEQDDTSRQFFAKLAQQMLLPDAINFAAFYLAPREAIWWGCLCLWQVFRGAPTKNEADVLDAVVRWVVQPSDANRREAWRMARMAKLTTVSSNLARAVYYSGGSVAPLGQPAVLPPPEQSAQCVVDAVTLAGRMVARQAAYACQRHFLWLATQVSRGEASWSEDGLQDAAALNEGELQHVE